MTSATHDTRPRAAFGAEAQASDGPCGSAHTEHHSAVRKATRATRISRRCARPNSKPSPRRRASRCATACSTAGTPVATGGLLGWIHHEDAAAATVAALEHGRGGQAYNVVDDRPASWEEVFTAMARAFGAPSPRKLPRWVFRLVAPYVATLAIDTSMRVSPAKAHAELGWRPAFPTYLDGIADMVSTVRQAADSAR
jgi:nucleoside-diphosphate-sugar epimerase